MKTFPAAVLLVLATCLVTVSAIACLLSPIASLDSRDIFVFALGIAGLPFGAMAVHMLRVIDLLLAGDPGKSTAPWV